jgi:hypothetical protein
MISRINKSRIIPQLLPWQQPAKDVRGQTASI